MIEATKQLEGQVAGKFVLRRKLGGDERKSVFVTDRADGSRAVIKLIAAEGLEAEKKLTQWKRGAELSHPHLLKLFEIGRCELSGTKYVYVVMEYAEENLAEVLPERGLGSEEVRETMGPALDALGYLHGKGLVNGQIRPSNFLAVRDQLKLATDSLRQAGENYGKGEQKSAYDPPEKPEATVSASADVWALGLTIVEMLTQRVPAWETSAGEPVLPKSLPEPFREIAQNCLRRDPNARWSIPQIGGRLKQPNVLPASKPVNPVAKVPEKPAPAPITDRKGLALNYGKWLPVAVVVLAAIVVLSLLLSRKSSSGNTTATSAEVPVPNTAADSTPKPNAGSGGSAKAASTASNRSGQGEIVHQALPKISPGAQRTIHGRIKLRVRVHVDQGGNVNRADMVSAGPSQYFARLTKEAAMDWKFVPSSAGERRWMLHFDLTRQGTTASAEQVR